MALEWQVFQTGLADLHRVPGLLTGDHEALLLDSGFTQSSGRLQVEAVKASGKTLKAIFVSCYDPDFYFGLSAVRAAFPDVPVLAPPVIASRIAETAAHKFAYWREQLGAEAPPSLAQVVLPEAYDGNGLMLDGQRIDIVTTQQPGHVHLWLPGERAILAGVQISSANHVWMADTPRPQDRAAWLASLDDMLARDPVEAMPGHMKPGGPTGVEAIMFTRDYIAAFDIEQANARDAAALAAAMRRRCPDLAMDFILDLSARVCMGEQEWS